MDINWYGLSCFKIRESGVTVVCDPYDRSIGLALPKLRADLITVDFRQPHLTPAFDVEAALVYIARGSDVRDVLVDGRLVMRDRVLLTVDEGALLYEARAAALRRVRAAGLDARLPGV